MLLFQLPPYLRKDVPRLTAFLDLLPAETRVAFEFRHASWQDDEVYEALRSRAAMLCVTDTDEGDTPFVATSDCGYVRLRRTHYDDADLARLGRAHRSRAAHAHLRLLHARGRGAGNEVRAADQRAMECGWLLALSTEPVFSDVDFE